jgi:predicted AlkP superfamily pyrophosphatase or phosphodiesterase
MRGGWIVRRSAPYRITSGLGAGALLIGLAALAALTPLFAVAESASKPPTVILISMDGTRPADVREDTLPSLLALGVAGVVAERLVPVPPSNTFPNHVSLITGVAPERHGLVNNIFVDPERGVFKKRDIPDWIEVEPLWSILESKGVPTAAYHWVGSEGRWPGGRAPMHWVPFSPKTPESEKVAQILAWLDLPWDAGRPRFIASWFHGADKAGHLAGPDTPAVERALRAQERSIARLIEGLKARDLFGSTTLIFVSDHGMTTAEREVDVGAALESAGINAGVYGIGGFATVVMHEGADPARAVKVVRGLGLEAFERQRAPKAWRVDHPRFGDVVVRAPVGTAVVYAGLSLRGFHGYDPEAESMAAIFQAAGRGVAAGTRLPQVRNTDVAPTVLALLGFAAPEWMEGRPIAAIVPSTGSSATLPSPAPAAHDSVASSWSAIQPGWRVWRKIGCEAAPKAGREEGGDEG